MNYIGMYWIRHSKRHRKQIHREKIPPHLSPVILSTASHLRGPFHFAFCNVPAVDVEDCPLAHPHISDASFQVPQGILTSSSVGLGNFHQCLSIKQHVKGKTIEGKFCMISTNIKETKTMSWLTGTSWLLETGVKSIIDGVKQRLDLSPMDAVLHTATCEGIGADEEEDGGTLPSPPAQLPPPPLLPRSGARSGTDKLIHFNAVSISLALCIPKACSVDDVLAPILNNKKGHFNYDTEFCRLRGDKPLVAADYIAIATSGAIDCIDGIRSISILWIILGHTVIASINKYTMNLFDFFVIFDQRTNMWLISGELAVDTYLVLSGLLLVYTSKSIKKIKQSIIPEEVTCSRKSYGRVSEASQQDGSEQKRLG
ncbi:hypothetical protein MSG28_006228 [Choristoneura fumiferana]|uniref:Uncharacterized protein n=1 Tax=Choristoneura fumiferana TaxID=7141 RepID=A0ACC0JE51_CHOFU|nr:hypothetical protein MSG28_006228 [Choristoneura fumiferana]